jgi:dTDP-4-dehydrorhamnose 3,5-epimerase
MIKLVLYDGREQSPTFGNLMELFIGEENYSLVTIPPGVVNGFKGIGTRFSLIANCATEPHSSDEIIYIDPLDNEIPYDWSLKHR